MPTWNDMFIRDSTADNGTIPSPGQPSISPDLICTGRTTYANPTLQFQGNYSRDPNVPPVANQNNYFYTRAMNWGSAAQGATMFVYWAPPSLLMSPNQWINNPLSIVLPDGTTQGWAPLPSVPNGTTSASVSVQQTPFAWNPGAAGHFCLVGICSTPANPWSPTTQPNFPTWESFVLWVRNHQTVCWRNLNIMSNPDIPEWDTTAVLQNTWSTATTVTIGAKCSANVPANTSIQIICTALGINYTQPCVPGSEIFTPAVTCPAGFNGMVETIAQTPGGAIWPSGALITTNHYWITSSNSVVAPFAADLSQHADHPHIQGARKLFGSSDGQFILMGSNSMASYNVMSDAHQPGSHQHVSAGVK